MIKIENPAVYGWEAAIRGMRNPMNSWDKSDTKYFDHGGVFRVPKIGSNDLKLMKSLSKAGNDHGKFLRMINVTCDITAPLYWWKEFDTYKVGAVANSCSTMHKIHAKEFTLDDFSHDQLIADWSDEDDLVDYNYGEYLNTAEDVLKWVIYSLNFYRNKYLVAKTKPMKEESKRKDVMKRYWWQMIQLLPSSYNQKRTVQLNYQVLKSMYFARCNHKLDEWHNFCAWCETLPYFKEICIQEDDSDE